MIIGYGASAPATRTSTCNSTRSRQRAQSPKTGEGRSLREIAAALAKAGYTTTAGNQFSASQVKRLACYRL